MLHAAQQSPCVKVVAQVHEEDSIHRHEWGNIPKKAYSAFKERWVESWENTDKFEQNRLTQREEANMVPLIFMDGPSDRLLV